MPFQGRHVETGSLIGSWPLIPAAVSGQPVLLPRTMQSKATILGILREPPAGYDVNGRSLILAVDGGNPTPISFSYGSFLPLSVVISQINTAMAMTVAFNDNNFLKLQSPTVGTGSLELSTDPASSPTDVFLNLGLFAGTVAYAGDLVQAQHPDPDRQVSTPGQMTMAEGESFEARVFNRAIAQLSINNDRNEGQLSKKRLAVREVYVEASYAPPVGCHGVQFSGGALVYVGKGAAPVIDDLKKLFAVLDSADREYSKDIYVPVVTGYTGTFATSTDGTNRQEVVSSAFHAISEPTAEKSYYLVSSAFTGGAVVFNGKPLKILEVRPGLGAASSAIIENIDPATGLRVAITQAGVAFDVGNRVRAEVVVDGVYTDATDAAASINRLENVRVDKRTGVTPTRVELGNRVVFVGQNFTTAPAVQIGDILNWHSSTIDSPFNNNGDYRVDKIIDKETLQVVASDWGPALLNPNTSGGSFGAVHIQTDGAFVKDPFIRFSSSATLYAQPTTGDDLHIAYFAGSTFRQASDDNPALFQGDIRFTQEADDTIARAVTQMWGPSVTSVDQVLYQDQRVNIESLNSRLGWEHYDYDDAEKTGSAALDTRSWGRHKDIRPDTIDMWYWTPASEVTPRVTLRGTAARGHGADVNTSSDALLTVLNAGGDYVLNLDSDGRMHNKSNATSDIRVWQDFLFHGPDTEPRCLGGTGLTGERVIWKGVHQWDNSAVDPDSVTLVGQDLQINNGLDGISVATRFQRFYGQRIQVTGTSSCANWASEIKFIELGGLLQKNATDYPDNRDAVDTLYGIHIAYALSSNFKIFNSHYGLKIADIIRAGTAVGGSGTNYAIYTGKGDVRFGDRALITPWQTVATNYGLYVGAVPALTTSTAAGVKVDFPTGTAQATLYGFRLEPGTNGTGAAMYGISLGALSSAGSNGSARGIVIGNVATAGGFSTAVGIAVGDVSTGANGYSYGLIVGNVTGTGDYHYGITITSVSGAALNNSGINVGAVSGAATNNYGLKLGDVSGGTNNYAIYTGLGLVRHGDFLSLAIPAGRAYGITVVPWTSAVSNVDAIKMDGATLTSAGGNATVLRAGPVSAGAYGYGIVLGAISAACEAVGIAIGVVEAGGAYSAYGIDVAAPSNSTSGATVIGLRLAMPVNATNAFGIQVTGATAATASMYGIDVGSSVATLGGIVGIVIESQTAHGADAVAYGLNMGGTVGDGSTGYAYGIRLAGVSQTHATKGYAVALSIGPTLSSGTSTGYAYGIDLGTVTGSLTARGITMGAVTAGGGAGVAYGISLDAASATGGAATGIRLGMPITCLTATGLEILPGSSTVATSVYGLMVGNLASSAGGAVVYAIYTGTGIVRFGDVLRMPAMAAPASPNQVGDMYVAAGGVLKICTVAGSPGTWVSVGSQA